MKNLHSKIILSSLVLITVFSCNKNEGSISEMQSSTATVADEVSTAASVQVKDRQFIKTASVNMEVKDVYDATVSIEKALKDFGGYVTSSNLQSNVISQDTYNTSDETAIMVKKFRTQNIMQLRIPTMQLGDFLEKINDKKVFLNSRIINAEEVTAQIKYAELEAQRVKKNEDDIATLKNSEKKVNIANQNRQEANQQELHKLNVADQIKYSTIEIDLKEPQIRVAEIPVINYKNMDNKYKFNFFYDVKNAFVEGFYLIQLIVVALIKIWPVLLITSVAIYFYRKRKQINPPKISE